VLISYDMSQVLEFSVFNGIHDFQFFFHSVEVLPSSVVMRTVHGILRILLYNHISNASSFLVVASVNVQAEACHRGDSSPAKVS